MIFLGIFECFASNKEGSGSTKGQLEIVEFIEKGKSDAPEFLKKIGDEMVFRGMAARFTALVAGYPEPEYEWFFNGKPLFPTDRYIKRIDKNVWSLIPASSKIPKFDNCFVDMETKANAKILIFFFIKKRLQLQKM